MKISVSFLSSNYSLKETLFKIANTSCDYLHTDIMDGIYVNNKTISLNKLIYMLKKYPKELDIHLMVKNPEDYIVALRKLHPKIITVHLETVKNMNVLINYLHHNQILCGIALNPFDTIESVKPYLDKIDLVLIMGVQPGFGGQEIKPDTIKKIALLRECYKGLISFDGGVNDQTVKLINSDIIVSGSYICKGKDYEEQINKLRGKI